MIVSIIIPSFNTKELLKECISSVPAGFDDSGKLDYEIIAVDNGSTDGSVELVKSLQLKVKSLRLVENKDNLGFARAVNQGIKGSGGDYLLLLNSDIRIEKGAISLLINYCQSNSVGIVAGALVNPDGTRQPSVFHFPTPLGAIKEYWLGEKGSYEKYLPAGSAPVKIDVAVAAVMLIPRPTIEKIGLFDEKYFMYFEDFDYCRRAHMAGLSVWYLPEAKLVHHHGASGKSLSGKPMEWLVASSKSYHGIIKYYLLTLIIRFGQFLKHGEKEA